MLPPIHSLIPRQSWNPYPTIFDRPAWENLPFEIKQGLIQRGETQLHFDWPPLPATLILEYSRDGNRSHYESSHFIRRDALVNLVLSECVQAEGRFLDDIANGIWVICEESFWGIPAHIGMTQKAGVGLPDVTEPTVDLFAAETAALLAWVDYLLGERLDAISTLMRPRIHLEIKRRMLDPCLARDDFWWMSFDPGTHSINNWNPWVNSNWLAAALLLEETEARRLAVVEKVLRSLDIFLSTYGESGGCDEGPGYWGRAGASLFDCLDLLYSATAGQFDVFDQPKIQNMGRFIYRTHIHNHYFVNFADASAINTPPPSLVFRYGECIEDAQMMAFGAWLAQEARLDARIQRDSLGRILPALINLDRLVSAAPSQPLPPQAWFDDIQVLACREQEGSVKGFFLAAKGGHNAESHNHNDIGSFIVFHDGLPVIIDAGVETYTRKTFSDQRYEIWTMQSAFHSLLPTFEKTPSQGVLQQAAGRKFAARNVGCTLEEDYAQLELDIAGAYPPEVGLNCWDRRLTLRRGHDIQIQDDFELSEPVKAIHLSILTPCELDLSNPGVISFISASLPDGRKSGQARFLFPPNIFSIRSESVAITDERLSPIWGKTLQRIVLTTKAGTVQRGEWEFSVRPNQT